MYVTAHASRPSGLVMSLYYQLSAIKSVNTMLLSIEITDNYKTKSLFKVFLNSVVFLFVDLNWSIWEAQWNLLLQYMKLFTLKINKEKLWLTNYVGILRVASEYAVMPSSRAFQARFHLTLAETAFRLLISLVISALVAVQLSPASTRPRTSILNAVWWRVQERPWLPLCQAVRAGDLWLAHFEPVSV